VLVIVQRVVGKELAYGWVSNLKQVAERGVGLQEGDDADGGGEYADGRAVG